ncbi:DUF72 domain-containing protein [Pendulispora albinea]|uniref:DUF72 domain-containing protein n=1 Tax=Pendulispora albinea TaxID=2741071 RepID=A0ABZ2M6E5_9BACT
MSTRYHIGAKSLRGGIPAYSKRFDLLEVHADPTSPSIAALRRWRKAVPPHFEFCVVAGKHLGAVKESPELVRELELAIEMIAALQARCFLLPTPVEVTPSSLWRERIARLLERLPRDATSVIWEPRGVWEHETAAAAAKKWGVVLSVDPVRETVPPGPVAYARLRALGETQSYGESALARVVSAIGPRRDAYVVLETASALAECKTLRRLAARGDGAVERGGGGRVVRPRTVTTMKVRDDEQE